MKLCLTKAKGKCMTKLAQPIRVALIQGIAAIAQVFKVFRVKIGKVVDFRDFKVALMALIQAKEIMEVLKIYSQIFSGKMQQDHNSKKPNQVASCLQWKFLLLKL